jgi:splicing factor U2AF subunit
MDTPANVLLAIFAPCNPSACAVKIPGAVLDQATGSCQHHPEYYDSLSTKHTPSNMILGLADELRLSHSGSPTLHSKAYDQLVALANEQARFEFELHKEDAKDTMGRKNTQAQSSVQLTLSFVVACMCILVFPRFYTKVSQHKSPRLCQFYSNIGACPRGKNCRLTHAISYGAEQNTVLIHHMYEPVIDDQETFDEFYEEVYCELSKYGAIKDMSVCDTISCSPAHLAGHVYVMFENQAAARRCISQMQGKTYAGQPLVATLSAVSNIRTGRCQQFWNVPSSCARGNCCNFLHIKKASTGLWLSLRKYGRTVRRLRNEGAETTNTKPLFFVCAGLLVHVFLACLSAPQTQSHCPFGCAGLLVGLVVFLLLASKWMNMNM